MGSRTWMRSPSPSSSISRDTWTRRGLVAGYREEGPSTSLLRELTHCLLDRAETWTITLAPLGLEDTLALFRKTAGEAAAEERGLAVYQETGGCPRQILALAADPD